MRHLSRLFTLFFAVVIITLSVMNREGEIVEEFEVMISEGYNRFELHIKDLEKGDYLVIVRDQYENKVSKRLVVYK